MAVDAAGFKMIAKTDHSHVDKPRYAPETGTLVGLIDLPLAGIHAKPVVVRSSSGYKALLPNTVLVGMRNRVPAKHVNVGNGMRWLEPGRTTDRYLASVEAWRLLVWRAVREDEVGSNDPIRVRGQSRRGRDNFAPFTRMELHG